MKIYDCRMEPPDQMVGLHFDDSWTLSVSGKRRCRITTFLVRIEWRVPPVPIPNTAVKPPIADGSET